jgi:hypothetical protein
MSRSGLMTLDPVVSLRSGRAADARTSNRETRIWHQGCSHRPAELDNVALLPPAGHYPTRTVSLRQSILRCARLARADAQS